MVRLPPKSPLAHSLIDKADDCVVSVAVMFGGEQVVDRSKPMGVTQRTDKCYIVVCFM